MRHLFVTQDYGPDLGGMARRHVELCRRFAPDEIIVSTVAAPDSGAFDRGERYVIERQPFGFDRANRFVNQMRWGSSLATIMRSAVRSAARNGGHPGVVHCGNIRPAGYALLAATAMPGARMPYVLYVYGGDLLREREIKAKNPFKRGVARAIFARASGIVAISGWSADLAGDLMRRLGIRRPPPVAAIELGTDPVQFSPARATGAFRARLSLGASPVMLTAARLVPHKGQDVGIRALSILAGEFPELRYVLVGEGPDRTRLERLARELHVDQRVVFAGPISDAELADAYATATIYLGASRIENLINAEGFGLAFVEAGASGVPSIAGDSGGVRSAVRDGETGFVVPPSDADAVAAALKQLLVDDSLRRRMGAAARRAVESHYNWDRVARETIAFACDAAYGSRRAPAPA